MGIHTPPTSNDKGPLPEEDGVEITIGLVEQIARRAAEAVTGVHHVGGPVRLEPMSGLARDVYALRKQTRGVYAERIDESTVVISLDVFMVAGAPIPDITAATQAAVRERVERQTRLTVSAVHLRIVGSEPE